MLLAKALRAGRGDTVSFVGGGGKTSFMFRLASELAESGFRVVTTTTTHISEQQVRMSPVSILHGELDRLRAELDQHRQCLVIGPPDGRGRVFGPAPELIAGLRARADVDIVLVEADGSRSLPFKAPGHHEPVVPDSTTILVPIAGINALGQPLDEAHVHRSEAAAALARQQPGSAITPITLARVLSHPEGGGKQRPKGARLIPALNKTDTETDLLQARETAGLLLQSRAVDGIAIGSMLHSSPVREMWTRTAGIVLAAGRASRFGSAKQALPWRDTTLVAHSARIALNSGLDPVIVVLGHEAETVERSLKGLPVRVVFNPDFEAGQSTSLQKGLQALPGQAGAAIFLLADQPLVTEDPIARLVQAHRESAAPACVPSFEGERGNPVLFDRSLFEELMRLRGDTGGRELLEKYKDSVAFVPADRTVLLDIDTAEDYDRLKF